MKITDNILYFADIPVETIMQEYGSPLYVYEESVLRSQFRELFAGFPEGLLEIHYSMKANSNPTLLRRLQQEGAWIDAVSPLEVRLALDAGFAPERILFTGNNSTPDEQY